MLNGDLKNVESGTWRERGSQFSIQHFSLNIRHSDLTTSRAIRSFPEVPRSLRPLPGVILLRRFGRSHDCSGAAGLARTRAGIPQETHLDHEPDQLRGVDPAHPDVAQGQ